MNIQPLTCSECKVSFLYVPNIVTTYGLRKVGSAPKSDIVYLTCPNKHTHPYVVSSDE